MSSSSAPAPSKSSSDYIRMARTTLRDHPFQSVLGLWGGVLGATGVYLYNRNIPVQLKIIQARIVAQAALIFGAASFAMVALLADDPDRDTSPAASTWVLRDFPEIPKNEQNLHPAMGAHGVGLVKPKAEKKLE